MSGRFLCAPEEIVMDDRLTKTELRVLLCLFLHQNKATQTAFPTRETISAFTGYHKGVVSKAVAGLKEKSWITVKQNRGPNRYFLAKPTMETVTTLVTVNNQETVTCLDTVTSLHTVTKNELNSHHIGEPTVTTVVTPEQNTNINNKEKRRRSEKAHTYTPADQATAEWMYQKILSINPGHKKPNISKWADTIRLTRERDGQTEQQIKELFTWVNQHGFWHQQILSPSNLRGKWDQLIIAKRGESRGKQNATDRNSGVLAKLDELAERELSARSGQNVDPGDSEEAEDAVFERVPVF